MANFRQSCELLLFDCPRLIFIMEEKKWYFYVFMFTETFEIDNDHVKKGSIYHTDSCLEEIYCSQESDSTQYYEAVLLDSLYKDFKIMYDSEE